MKYQNEVTPIQKLPLHICINCITQTRDFTQNKYSKILIQHIQIPCREEESQKHEAHLNRKYWKRNKLQLDLRSQKQRSLKSLQLLRTCILPPYNRSEARLDQVYPEKSSDRQPLKTSMPGRTTHLTTSKKTRANTMATQILPEVTLLNEVFLDTMNGRKVYHCMLHICLH